MDKSVPKPAAFILDNIRGIETGSVDERSYNTVYGHNEHKLTKQITKMNIQELIDNQKGFTKAFGSSASGGYQFMRQTMLDLKKELKLRTSQIFDANLQDRLGYHLLLRRGYDRFISGAMSLHEFMIALAKEWASFPVPYDMRGQKRNVKRGQSYYAGDGMNKALISAEKVEAMLKEALRIANTPETVIISSPVETVVKEPVVADPGELSTPPAKSKTVWTNAITVAGMVVTGVGSFMGGLDWRVQLFIAAVVAAFGVYAIKRRYDLYREVKNLYDQFNPN